MRQREKIAGDVGVCWLPQSALAMVVLQRRAAEGLEGRLVLVVGPKAMAALLHLKPWTNPCYSKCVSNAICFVSMFFVISAVFLR